ncbi:hypothetical protein, partial [Brasilonema octagenarum]
AHALRRSRSVRFALTPDAWLSGNPPAALVSPHQVLAHESRRRRIYPGLIQSLLTRHTSLYTGV